MRWVVIAVGLGGLGFAGCGRLGFDDHDAAASADGVLGHDEDGDGVPDLLDVCPHIAGPQVDSDGDGVGDACDPEPANPRQHRALFTPMTPDDQPFTTSTDGILSQEVDSLHFNGVTSTSMRLGVPAFTDVQITMGIDVEAVLAPAAQHQLALHAVFTTGDPEYFVELNEIGSQFSWAAISFFDGNSYVAVSTQTLPAGFHPGAVTLRFTGTVGNEVDLAAGWPGEMYQLSKTNLVYQGGTQIRLDINNLVVDVRYLYVVTSS